MAKYNFYAVAVGADPDTKEELRNLLFSDWNSCKPYVVGVEGAKYKGFLTPDEAHQWMKQVNGDLYESLPEAMMKTMQSNVSYDDEFKAVCESLGLFPGETLAWLQKRFVEEHRYIKNKSYLVEL